MAIAGNAIGGVANELAGADVEEVLVLDDPALEPYSSDGFVKAWTQVIDAKSPQVVLLPHTYQTRDFAPRLAMRLDRRLITDCVATKAREEGLAFVRPMYQGKFVVDIVLQGHGPHFVSFQIGSFRSDSVSP